MPTKKIKLELSFRKKDQSNLLGILSIVFGVVGLFVFGLVNAAEWFFIKRGREVLK